MFKKILLKFFPNDIKDNALSLINFHLNIISPELFYFISIKKILENRKINFLDTKFSYLENRNNNFLDMKKDIHYRYKIFWDLNWRKKYSINIIAFTVSVLASHIYYEKIKKANLIDIYIMLNKSFYDVMYVYFARIKQYPDILTDEEKFKLFLDVFIELFSKNMIANKVKKIKDNADKIRKILLEDVNFLYFVYSTTKYIQKIYIINNDIDFYKWIIWGMLIEGANITNLLKKTSRDIYIKRYSSYFNADFMSLINLLVPEYTYIDYMFKVKDLEVFDYLQESLDFLDNTREDILHIWKDKEKYSMKNILSIIDITTSVDLWKNNFFDSLKKYNNIILAEEYGWDVPAPEDVKWIMMWKVPDVIKKVSNVNESFMDFYILLWSDIASGDSAMCQSCFLSNDILKLDDFIINFLTLDEESVENLLNIYYLYDNKYFENSIRIKKNDDKTPSFLSIRYNTVSDIIINNIFKNYSLTLLQDFNSRLQKEYIEDKKYFDIVLKNFSSNIKKYLKEDKVVCKYYFDKKLGNLIPYLDIEKMFIKSFKENIYASDFIVFDFVSSFIIEQFKNNWYMDNQNIRGILIIILARIRDSFFGYIIFRKILAQDKWGEIIRWLDMVYSSYIFDLLPNDLIDIELMTILDKLATKFTKKYKDFIDYFVFIKENQDFIKAIWNIDNFVKLEKYDTVKRKYEVNWQVYDTIVSIQKFNKRYVKFEV